MLFLPLHALANPEEDFEELCKLAYTKIDLGKTHNTKHTERASCIVEVEKEVHLLAKDSEFRAPVGNRKFDKRVFLYVTIGGTAFTQCGHRAHSHTRSIERRLCDRSQRAT